MEDPHSNFKLLKISDDFETHEKCMKNKIIKILNHLFFYSVPRIYNEFCAPKTMYVDIFFKISDRVCVRWRSYFFLLSYDKN